MVALPVATPNTTPVLDTEAIEVLLLVHTPPASVSLKVVVPPVQTVEAPVIRPAPGNGLTVTVAVALRAPQVLEVV
jgi:hypothetical protein